MLETQRQSASPPELVPPPHGMPPVSTGHMEGAKSPGNVCVPPRYPYIHNVHPISQWVSYDAHTNDCKHDQDFIPDFLTDDHVSTGYYTICRVVMQLTWIFLMRATVY
jgi:hypothetical protein